MKTHEHTFEGHELAEAGDLIFDVEYVYSDDRSEIHLPDGWEKQVESAYAMAGRAAMKKIEDMVKNLEFDEMPRIWATEDALAYAEAKGESLFEEKRC